jgi:ABC-type Fe3+/spermidine/putrescine transport system ATPase subunit
VRVRGVRRSFEAELAPVRALRGLDLDVAGGEFVALMGPSGCGKSTLLNVIAGLDRPDEGSVEVAGERIDGRDEEWLARFRRRHVGVIFQFFSLLDGVSVLDNLVLVGILGGMRRRAAISRGRDLLGLLDIGEHGGRPPAPVRSPPGPRPQPSSGPKRNGQGRGPWATGSLGRPFRVWHGGHSPQNVTSARSIAKPALATGSRQGAGAAARSTSAIAPHRRHTRCWWLSPVRDS